MSARQHLLVDGSNVMHAWADLRRLAASDRATAQEQLVQRLTVIRDVDDIRLTVVFDGKGPELTLTHPGGDLQVSVVYTPSGATADQVIEQLTANSRADQCWIATNDRMERETVTALGAQVLGAEDVLAWAQRAEQRLSTTLADLKRRAEQSWKP